MHVSFWHMPHMHGMTNYSTNRFSIYIYIAFTDKDPMLLAISLSITF